MDHAANIYNTCLLAFAVSLPRLQSMALFAKILGALKGAPRSAGAQKQQIAVKNFR